MTVSDAVFGSAPPSAADLRDSAGRDAQPRGRARIADTERDVNAPGVLRRSAATVRADVAGAWPWRGSAPTLLDLWQARIPDIARVPGDNKVLWIGWAVVNHAALIPTAYFSTLLWALQHPCRYPIAAVLITIFALIVAHL